MPADCPGGLVPLVTIGDGNCFARAVSTALFGNQNHHREIRVRLVIEGVKNKCMYLDNEYLKLGATHVHKRGTFPQQYALFIGQNLPSCGSIDDTVEVIYDRDILDLRKDRLYTGMWQIWQACNIIGRPIRSVFPMRGSVAFQGDFNRLCIPKDVRKRQKVPLNIMWTPVRLNRAVVHFVPLL